MIVFCHLFCHLLFLCSAIYYFFVPFIMMGLKPAGAMPKLIQYWCMQFVCNR